MIRTQVLEHFPGAGKGKKRANKGNVRGGTAARQAVKKSRGVMVVHRKEVIGDDSIEYYFFTRV